MWLSSLSVIAYSILYYQTHGCSCDLRSKGWAALATYKQLYWLSRQSPETSGCAQWPGSVLSRDIVSSLPFLTSVSKKLPLPSSLKLIHLLCLLRLYSHTNEQLLQQWLVELGYKCPYLKIIILSLSYQLSEQWLSCSPWKRMLLPFPDYCHIALRFHCRVIKCNIPSCHSQVTSAREYGTGSLKAGR